MKYCGKHVYLRPSSSDLKGLWNLSVGDYTSIPKGSVFYCTEAPLTIGRKVIFGPRPTIITGDHRIDVVGKYIIDSTEKCPPYSIIGGIPAKVLKMRFTPKEIEEYERKVY